MMFYKRVCVLEKTLILGSDFHGKTSLLFAFTYQSIKILNFVLFLVMYIFLKLKKK